jgi:molecular chaperone DnaK
MKKDAEANAAADAEKKEKIEARNKADNMLYIAEKTLKDAGDKVKPEDKTEVEAKVKALKDILETGSKEDLEKKTSELSDVVQKVAAATTPQPGAEQAQPVDEATPAGDAKADEKKDDKKDDKKVEEGEVVS